MSTSLVAAEQQPESTLALAENGRFSGQVRRTVLAGGLRVITEHVPAESTATFCIVVANGSRDEPAQLAGVTHFLEHMLFKGTARRSWEQINAELDSVGAEHNAFTSREQTGYWAASLAADLPKVVDVISDVVANAILPADEVATERPVILEEISTRRDRPDVHAHDELATAMFGEDSALGRLVVGNAQSLARISRDELDAYYRSHYTPANLIVTAAGGVDHDRLVEQIRQAFSTRLQQAGATAPSLPRQANNLVEVFSGTKHVVRHNEQMVITMGLKGLAHSDPRLPAVQVLNAMIANAPSSRLYQEVRERRGLVYTIRSRHVAMADTGIWSMRLGCSPRRASEVMQVCRDELAAIAQEGLTQHEVARARGYVAGQAGLGTASTGHRTAALAQQELYANSGYSDLDQEHERVLAVTDEDVRQVASELLGQAETVVMVGPDLEDPVPPARNGRTAQ